MARARWMVVGALALAGLVASTMPAGAESPRAAAERAARAEVARVSAGVVPSVVDCVGPAGDPAPDSQEWKHLHIRTVFVLEHQA